MDHEFYRCCVDIISLTEVSSYKELYWGQNHYQGQVLWSRLQSQFFLYGLVWGAPNQWSQSDTATQKSRVYFQVFWNRHPNTPMQDPTCKVQLGAQFSGIDSPGCGVRHPPPEQAAQASGVYLCYSQEFIASFRKTQPRRTFRLQACNCPSAHQLTMNFKAAASKNAPDKLFLKERIQKSSCTDIPHLDFYKNKSPVKSLSAYISS